MGTALASVKTAAGTVNPLAFLEVPLPNPISQHHVIAGFESLPGLVLAALPKDRHDRGMALRQPVPIWRWRLLFGAAGTLALGTQTYLLREFLVLLQGDEMAVGLGLAAWFVGIVAGARAARHVSDNSARFVATGSVSLLGLLGCTAVVAARFARGLAGFSAFEPLSLGPALAAAGSLFFVPGVCVGVAFVALATAASVAIGSARNAISGLYVFEAFGSLVAGLLVSLVLSVYLTPIQGIGLLVGVSLLGALPSALVGEVAGKHVLLLATVLALALPTTKIGSWLESTTEKARFAALAVGNTLLAVQSTPYQHVAVGGTEQRVLYANGQYVASFPDPAADELLAHELMLFSQRPSRLLSFGGLEMGLLRYCLRHPVSTIDIVSLDSHYFHLLTRYLASDDRKALSDSRVHFAFEDPRRFLGRAGQPYDLIISLDPAPNTLFLARTTSLEFNQLVRSRLAPDGVYVTRFSAGENLQSGNVGLLGATLHSTLRAVFPVVRATPGPISFFVAGNSTTHVSIDAKELERRFRERFITTDVPVAELLPELLPEERVATLNTELERASRSIPSARDDHPIAFLHALSVRHQISGSHWASLHRFSTQRPQWLVALLLAPSLVLLVLTRTRRDTAPMRAAAWHATTVMGACGLTANLLLFVSFQTRVGALYSELGALSGLFMLGLAAGGFVAASTDRPHPLLRAQLLGWLLSVLLMFVFGFAGCLSACGPWLWLLHVLALVCMGFGTGLVFPAASHEYLASLDTTLASRARQVASHLELCDHAGAAVAALIAAVLLIPTLGLVRCAGVLVGLQTVALTITWLSDKRAQTR